MIGSVDLVVLDPAGNTTILVTSPVPKPDYPEVANRLLEMDFGEYCPWADSVMAEQVAYALEDEGEYPAMNMCGLEFCGNASRSFAYYRVKAFGDGEDIGSGQKQITVRVSGCAHPLRAEVDAGGNYSSIEMPLPVSVKMVDTAEAGVEGTYPLIDLDGISHIVMNGVEPSAERFDSIKEYIYRQISPDMEAFGTMFIDEEKGIMSPVVYVRDVDTTYFEGSCASGTASAAAAKAMDEDAADGTFHYTFRQPAGSLDAAVTKKDGQITSVTLGGSIEMSGNIHVEL